MALHLKEGDGDLPLIKETAFLTRYACIIACDISPSPNVKSLLIVNLKLTSSHSISESVIV